MPELPEVETVMRGLEPAMSGQKITRADVRREGLRWPFPENMAERLTGQRVEHLHRRAKYLLIDLSGGESLIVHLGMSGQVLISTPDVELRKHDHVVLDLDNGKRITFNDARRFGMIDLCATDALDQNRMLAGIGPEPLGNDFNAGYLVAKFQNRKTPIKTALLDQKIIAGLGNIYVCEALWRVGVSPETKVQDLPANKTEELVTAIRDVLQEAIIAGGSSLKDYRQADGELGYFQHSFAAYGREGEPCRTKDCDGVIERIQQSGRSTFFCRSCQR